MYLPDWKVCARVDKMNPESPTPQEARASLEEAKRNATTVRRSDGQLRLVLLVVAAMYLATAALVSANPRGGNVFIGDALLIVFLSAFGSVLYLTWRIRAWSRAGLLWFVGSVAAFLVWNGAVIWISIATGWWGRESPGYHFGGSAMVAVIPLVVAAWLIGRR
jgi:hypothetical protein